MADWYYSDEQRNRHGPLGDADLAALHAQQRLRPDTLVWREGLPHWQPWRTMMAEVMPVASDAGLAPGPAADHGLPATGFDPDIATPPLSRSPYAPPQSVVLAGEEYRAGDEVVDAGFWKRFAALVIDSLLVGIAFYVVVVALAVAMGITMGGMGNGAAMGLVAGIYLAYPLISGLYYVLMETSTSQATLGKMAVGIKVVDRDGRRLTRAHGFGRWTSHLLCYLTLYIGYLMVAFTARKRGLHDMAAGVLVVDRWAYTAHPEHQRRELGAVALVVMVLGVLLMLAYLGVMLAIAIPAYNGYLQRAGGA